MYPVSLGFAEAQRRINSLLRNGHAAEALVTSVFTVEKTLRRTLKQLIISAGFTSRQATRILKEYRGLKSLKDHWDLFDPANRKLLALTARPWDRSGQSVRSAGTASRASA